MLEVTPKDAWNAAYNQLELQLDRASFETWLRAAVFIRVDDGVFVIGVHNSYAQDMLQHRLYRNVCRVLSDVRGEHTDLRFIIHKEEPTNTITEADDQPPLFRFLAQQERIPDFPETSRQPRQPSFFESVSPPKFDDLPESDLNPRFTFDRMVVNQSNRIVYEASLAVAEYPATVYNPLLVYGGVGLGKTHLLQSIGHVCMERGLRTIYIPSEVFTNDLVNAIRQRTTAMFRDKYRSVDVLLVDDVQFIGGKDSTQEEFFHTFNTLINFNKQIIMASDRHPRELKTLQDRLRSRFQGGLVADVQPPEFETRLAILEMWAEEQNVQLENHVLQMIAERAPHNVRELQGVFNQIVAQTRFGGGTVSHSRVANTIERFSQPRERVTLQGIIETTAQKYSLEARHLTGKSRKAQVNKARQIAMYLCREMTEYSLPQIGEAFGGRSHTTVLHGVNKVEEQLEYDRVLEAQLLKLRQSIAQDR